MSTSGDRLRRYADRAAHEGGQAAANAMARVGQDAQRRELNRKSHPPETKTPSAPGSPPARITGNLLRSIHTFQAVSVGAYRWESKAGSEGLIYAKVQAYGKTIHIRNARFLVWRENGITHRAKRVYIPPRPWIPPASQRIRADGSLHRASVEAFHRAVYG